MAVEAVLFDFGLVLSGPPNSTAWAHMLTVAASEEQRFHDGYWAFRTAYDRGDLSGRDYWTAVGEHAGIRLDAAQIDALIAADTALWTDLNAPMVEWAQRLQRAGFKTGILSNIGDSIAEGICAKLAWLDGFDHCTWSHAWKMAKPQPEIYRQTAAALGVLPERILFVDDREENCEAALAVGMEAVRYTDHASFEQAMQARGLGWLLEVGSTA